MRFTRFMRLAIKQAERSPCRYRVGAVLVVGTRVLAASPNRPRNSPAVDFEHATFHAEEAAIRRAGVTRNFDVYVARVDAAGNTACAKPCPRCSAALAVAGVRRTYYTRDSTSVGTISRGGWHVR